jgi:aspartate aminotransferase-like enzyme
MGPDRPLIFKQATEDWELGLIRRLNYRTFVEEIPQHGPDPGRTLVDRFDGQNVYFVCLRGRRLLGMVAVRGERPFSLDQKLGDLDAHLPAGRSICEIRLLAVEPEHRNGVVLLGLMRLVAGHCLGRGHDLAIISGAVGRRRLYERLGFVPFGPLVGSPGPLFQPMYLTREAFDERAGRLRLVPPGAAPGRAALSLLPGPVAVVEPVRRALVGPPVSHRSEAFEEALVRTKRLLRDLVGARHVQILVGTGTLANDVVAAQLSLAGGRGLILTNGEFGDRLVDHAGRLGLAHEVHRPESGEIFERDPLERALDRGAGIEWLWAVHCETSTGVLNDLDMLRDVCGRRGVRLCLDAVSSIGTVPVDLRDVVLASGVGGKGLGAYPGLAMVFHDQPVRPAPGALPRYLDLGLYAEAAGVPFTHSSNLLSALEAALLDLRPERRFGEIARLAGWLRRELRERGLVIVAPDAHASPAVITVALPRGIDSGRAGRELEKAGFLLGYRSAYLLRRNWIQIGLMGACAREDLLPLLGAIGRIGEAAPAARGPLDAAG